MATGQAVAPCAPSCRKSCDKLCSMEAFAPRLPARTGAFPMKPPGTCSRSILNGKRIPIWAATIAGFAWWFSDEQRARSTLVLFGKPRDIGSDGGIIAFHEVGYTAL